METRNLTNLEMLKLQNSLKNKTTAWVLFAFLGGFGGHCFYIGKKWLGISLIVSAIMIPFTLGISLLAYIFIWFYSIFIVNSTINTHNEILMIHAESHAADVRIQS